MRSRTGLKVISVLGVFAAIYVAMRCVAVIGLRDEVATGQVSVLRSNSFMPPSGMVAYEGSPAVNDPAAPAAPRKPHAPPTAGEVRTLSIKELGNFPYADTGGTIPDDVRALDGATVRLTGYMVPPNQLGISPAGEESKVTRFSLVPNLSTCCYGKPPGVQHVIDVRCDASRSISFTPRPVVVEGKLKVGEVKDDGFVVSVFGVVATNVSEQRAGE
jgi:hypothetical protein